MIGWVLLFCFGGVLGVTLPECPVWRIPEVVDSPLTVNLEADTTEQSKFPHQQEYQVKVISGDGDEFADPGGAVVAWRPAFVDVAYESTVTLNNLDLQAALRVGWSVYAEDLNDEGVFDQSTLLFSCGFVLGTDSDCNPLGVQSQSPGPHYLAFQTRMDSGSALVQECRQVDFNSVRLQLQYHGDYKWQCFYREAGDDSVPFTLLGEYDKDKPAAAVAVDLYSSTWQCPGSQGQCRLTILWSTPSSDCQNPELNCPSERIKKCLPFSGPPGPFKCWWLASTADPPETNELDDSGLRTVLHHREALSLVGKDIDAQLNQWYLLSFALASNVGNNLDIVVVRVGRSDGDNTGAFEFSINPRLTLVFYRFRFKLAVDCIFYKCALTFRFTTPGDYRIDDVAFCKVNPEDAPSPLPQPSPDVPEDPGTDLGSQKRRSSKI